MTSNMKRYHYLHNYLYGVFILIVLVHYEGQHNSSRDTFITNLSLTEYKVNNSVYYLLYVNVLIDTGTVLYFVHTYQPTNPLGIPDAHAQIIKYKHIV